MNRDSGNAWLYVVGFLVVYFLILHVISSDSLPLVFEFCFINTSELVVASIVRIRVIFSLC